MRSFFKSILVPAFALTAAGLFMLGCPDTGGGGDTRGGGTCVPGAQTTCACPGGTMSVQVCLPNGTLDACQCEGNTGGNGGAGGSMSTSSGMGGGGGCMRPAGTPMTCGNGTVDLGEDCDDGNCVANDACNNNCKLPACGDGVVQMGELCDPPGKENCPADCGVINPTGGGGMGGGPPIDPCPGKLVVAGFAAAQKGAFSYNGQIGLDAAAAACAALGGFQMCDYDQWKELENNPMNHTPDITKLAMLIPSGTCKKVWLHRTTAVGGACPAGPGGRCNDWNYETDHIADGEWVEICNMAGNITYNYQLDCDPTFDPNNPGPHQGMGMPCNVAREIPCCYEKCIPMQP